MSKVFNVRLPRFDGAQLEAVCKVLGDTTTGLTGPEIGHILASLAMADPDPGMTKWKRLYNAFVHSQNEHQVGNLVILFINEAMAPARYLNKLDTFEWRRIELDAALSFAGYAVNKGGKVVLATRETTLEGARARAGRLHSLLETRATHSEVFKYCKAELLQENYFHAVFEAVKGLAERIRQMSSLTSDGADLVTQAFSVKAPVLRINTLRTETDLSEQKGFVNLLIGVFGAVRNPTAHAPKLLWSMPEQDAVDIFALVSYLHRKLDGAVRVDARQT